jgi:hypothetical protein
MSNSLPKVKILLGRAGRTESHDVGKLLAVGDPISLESVGGRKPWKLDCSRKSLGWIRLREGEYTRT